MENVKTYDLLIYTKKKGKVVNIIEAVSKAQLKGYLLSHTLSVHRDAIIFEKDTGDIIFHAEGRESGFPKFTEGELGNIDTFCPGLLKRVQE